MWTEISEAVQPGLLVIIDGLITLLLGYITVKLPSFAKLWFEGRRSAHLQATLLNGARMALEGKLTGETAIDAIVDYAKRGATEAITYFGASESRLRDMAMAKLHQLLNK